MPARTLLDPDLGRIEIVTLNLPDTVQQPIATFTSSGSVLVAYRASGDPPDWLNLAVTEHDADRFRVVFSGKAPLHPKGNGLRLLPFQDGSRVLLGDYVVECDPCLDDAERARLVPIRFPELIETDPGVLFRWSEPVVAPDNQHIAWTVLHATAGALNVLGTLRREVDHYTVDEPRVISDTRGLERDPGRPDVLHLSVMRGGEIKQFIRGGAALSLAGSGGRALVDSVRQDLDGPGVFPLTLTPGYDETTILSPDERLGIVMSTRFSATTSCAVVDLLPRPLAAVSGSGLAMPVYLYAVAGVRDHRPGNIGPALVDLAKATVDSDYLGADLSDPDGEWVYLSPMSWHPSSRRAMWNETRRGSDRDHRIGIATLLDREPGQAVEQVSTPTDIGYALPLTADVVMAKGPARGTIAGRASGTVTLSRSDSGGLGQTHSAETVYTSFSDDGTTFWDGTERISTPAGSAATVYEADLRKSGDDPGDMRLRLTFVQPGSFHSPVSLSFDLAEDGRPASHGYATYRGRTLRVEDLTP